MTFDRPGRGGESGRSDIPRDEASGVIGMGRTEAKSGHAAKRPIAATSGASLPRDVSVLSIVADLEGRRPNHCEERRGSRAVRRGGGAAGHVDFLADGNGDFAKAISLDLDLSAGGLGLRGPALKRAGKSV